MKKAKNSLMHRVTAMLFSLLCLLSLLPAPAMAADTSSIKLESCGYSGVRYESDALGVCRLHQMFFENGGITSTGFCANKGMGMGNSLIGQTWGNPTPITDPTVKCMMAYFYAHASGTFTDEAHALGEDQVWDAGYTWYMNAYVQAIIWRYKEGLLGDPVVACAEELMAVYNAIGGNHYTSIDDIQGTASFRDHAAYHLALGERGVWGDVDVYEYTHTGAGSSAHPAGTIQGIIIGKLKPMDVTNPEYTLTIKKVDSTNPTKGLAGAEFHVQSTNGSYQKDVVTGEDGTVTLRGLTAQTYQVTETQSPAGYQIDNAGPEYVVLPNGGSNSVTVTFTDTPVVTASGSIRKVDADNSTRGLAGSVIEIVGVDNNFSGRYTSVADGSYAGIPWGTMPIGAYVCTEVTPPQGYTLSSDPAKVKQSFYWDGHNTISLVFENDAKVKVRLIKQDASGNPLSGAVFNILKDGQLIGSEATNAAGTITVSNVTEGLFAFVEVSSPSGFARTQPVFAHVDQATVDGGGTITVTAVDNRLPNLTITKLDAQTKEPLPNTVFEVRGIHYGYHQDVSTGANGSVKLTAIPVDSYEVVEKSVEAPYVLDETNVQTIWLGPGDNQTLVFENLKQPLLTISKTEKGTTNPIPGTTFTIEGIDSDYKHDVTTEADGTVSLRVAPGSYLITEKAVPAPFYLPSKNADRIQTISLNAGDEKTVSFSDYRFPELTIYKEDSVAGAPVEGALFHVTYVSNGEAADAPGTVDFGEMLTGADGEIRLHEKGKRIYPGEYTCVEVRPASGFQMKEPTTQKIILHGSESKTLTFQNEPLNAIIVEKYDRVTGEALPGCTFQLRFLGGLSGTGGTVIGQKVTGKNGTCIWTGLTSGTYICEEVDPGEGYTIIQSSETVYLADSGEQSVVTVRFQNAPDGILLIRKVCSANPSVMLQDAEFEVRYADGTLIGDENGIFKSDENGLVRISGLKPGKSVVVTERRAPDGFLIDTQPQTIQIKEGKVVALTFKNDPKGKLIIQKRDAVTNEVMPGVEFRVTTAAGCEVGLDGVIGDTVLTQNGIFTTDAQGEVRLSGLIPGAYVISEISTWDSHIIDTPSTNVVIGNKGDTQTVVIKNSRKGTLLINKKDAVTGAPLSDVEFTVTDSAGNVIGNANGKYVTDMAGTITIPNLNPGDTLVVKESRAKSGYILDDAPQTVKIKANETVSLEFRNQPKGALIINKRDSVTGEPLEGVEFKITTSDGQVVPNKGGQISSNGVYYTNSEGQIMISPLEPNTYVITETAAIPGYTIHEATRSQTVVVNTNDTQTVYFYNDPNTTLIIHKYIEGTDNEPLAGVAFKVTDGNGGAVGPNDGVYYTDKSGDIVLHDLIPGTTVTAREIKTVDGFVLDGTPQDIYIKGGEVQELTFWNAKAGSLVIRKLDSQTKKPLAGVQFELTYADGGFVDNANGHLSSNGLYTTSENGEIRIEGITGTVVCKEVKSIPGYTFNPETAVQTVVVRPDETQTLTFYNDPTQTLTIQKYIDGTTTPIQGVTFLVTSSDGTVLGPNNGEYVTDEAGRIVLNALIPGTTVTAKELRSVSGFVLDSTPKSILIKQGEAQTLTFFNKAEGGLELIKVSESDKAKRLANVTFEIRRMDGALVDTVTTDSTGRVHVNLDAGDFYCVEIEAAKGFKLDATPHYFIVRDGKTTTLTVTNKAFSGILIHKIDKATRKGIYGVTFLLYDSSRTPIGQYTSDDKGYVYIEELSAGRYYLRELENEGYIVDEQMKTVYVEAGRTTEIVWENSAVTGQIQITKTSEDYNSMNGWPAGTPIPGTEFEIYSYRTGNLVDTVRTDKRGVAVSSPLPLGRYKIVESRAAEFFDLDQTPIEVEIEYAGQIVKAAMTNKALYTNVSIKKTGYVEVMPGQTIRYEISGVANNSTTALTSFYVRDTLPAAVQLEKLVTGTWNVKGNYKIVYQTNMSNGEWRVLADNLNTQQNYVLDASPAALGLSSGEYVTEFMESFGVVPSNFRQVEKAYVFGTVRSWVDGGSQIVNQADAGGVYNGQWIMATSRWVTKVYAPSKPLPRTGY